MSDALGKHGSDAGDVTDFLRDQDAKSLLRFITCGSVDDGKSTLIGRLLYDSKLIYDDQLAAVERDSKTSGTTGAAPDLALLVDGLAAEREQGITIDVAYRFFSTDRRKFIVADTPGHEQYTRNMATGASTADVALLLIDVRHGVQVQTRRHAYIASLLGVRHVAVVVNKMDLVYHARAPFDEIETEFAEFAQSLGFASTTFIPVSALDGDNVTSPSDKLDWYEGPTLLSYLETVDADSDDSAAPFRFPIQWVNRPNSDFRGYAGTVASGSVAPGDEVMALPSGQRARVARVVTRDGDREIAGPDAAVTLVLDSEIDLSRGDLLCSPKTPAESANHIQAKLIWMDDKRLFSGRQYAIRTSTGSVTGTITRLKHRIDVNDLSETPARSLGMNEIGKVNISLAREIPFDAYDDNRTTGAFIVVDRMSNRTVGAGMIDYALRRAKNIVRQGMTVDREARAEQKSQTPTVLWFTGLSGSGKSTIANLVEQELFERGHHTYALDGDNLRHGLNRDLGFRKADRVENIRRVAEVANLMADAGLIVTCSFISPYSAERQLARDLIGTDNFVEIFVDTPLEVAEARDVKGLYAKARAGEIKNFTGIDSEYQVPQEPDLRIDTTAISARDAARKVIAHLEALKRLPIAD